MYRCYLSILLIATLALSSGCSVPSVSARAEAGRTDSSAIEIASIPYDTSKPKFAILVEPFQASQDVITITRGQVGSTPLQDQMAAQLVTALTHVGNFVLYDSRSVKKIPTKKGVTGPYVLRATLTEFNEAAEASYNENGGSLGIAGAILGIAGAIAGKPGLMWAGAGVAAANPTLEQSEATKKGVVAFDVQVVEKSSGRIVGSFEAAGTFSAQSAVNGFSLFGIGNKKAAFASSALGQALRAAMNDAVRKAYDTLT